MTPRCERWLATCASLADYPVQVGYARSELFSGAAGDVAQALDELSSAANGAGPARAALGAFVPAIVDRAHLDRLGELRAAAKQASLTAAQRLLRCSTARGHLLDREDEPDAPAAREGEGERPLTLGERRSLARRPSRAFIARLMVDPHPMVVRILLANPKLTEDDVVLMAARRPAARDAAVEIAKAWCRSGRVRLALALNPGTPPGVAVPLLSLLTRPELDELRAAVDVRAVVRSTARELCALRAPLGHATSPAPKH